MLRVISPTPDSPSRHWWHCSVLYWLAVLPAIAAGETARAFDIPAGSAEQALRLFVAQSRLEVLFATDVAAGIRTNAVQGEMTPTQALSRLLAGTPLRIVRGSPDGVIRVARVPDPNAARAAPIASDRPAPTTNKSPTPPSMKSRPPLSVLAAWLALAAAPGVGAQPASPSTSVAGSAVMSGTVSNAATRNRLAGAHVDVPQLGLGALTDDTGHFVLGGLPAGTHEVVVSYLGLDAFRSQATFTAGERITRDFELTSGIYRMEEFKVTGEREGDAAAITAQRNAPNVKNVVASDAFGNLPNLSASEVVMRMPGVAANTNAGGLNATLIIRGIGNNAVTLDGGMMTGEGGGMNRAVQINNLTAAMVESVELVKGHTPDKGAESLGGTINLKSRSPLSIAEKRRTTYNFGVRWAPPFTDQIPLREQHRMHPLLNLSHQEVFDVFGGSRNLGVALNLYYSENIVDRFSTTREFQDTPASAAYLWDFGNIDQYANRKLTSVNLKVDYQFTPTTRFTFNTIYNDNNGSDRINYQMRAFTTQTVGTTGTAGILPGYTDLVTRVRAAAGSNIDLTSSQLNTWDRLRHVTFGIEHKQGAVEADLTALFSIDHINSANDGESGTLTQRISAVGWLLDRTNSDVHPRFVQTEGPDFANAANYRPTANGLNNQNNSDDQNVRELRGNLLYRLPFFRGDSASLKSGFLLRENEAERTNLTRRWTYIGSGPLAPDATVRTNDGYNLPHWNPSSFIQQREADPTQWREDRYFFEQNKYTGTQSVTERITAGYLMAQGRLGRTGILTGVRTERTDIESAGWTRARVASTAAQQLADPVGSAQRDYANNHRSLDGSYTKSFPSVHVSHDVTANLKARLSWSTSFGRPPMTNYLPNETVNEATQTLTVNNPSLRPQTADSWDATLEYYFEPVGSFSVGWFHKQIRDYIVRGAFDGIVTSGADNGYNGEYSGFTRLTTTNAGTAYVQGWEFSYQQQFTFLPGLLKGLSTMVNYTVLDSHGNFGGATSLSSNQVPGFIPRTGNVSLAWRYRKFGARLLANYTGDWLQTSAASPTQNLYRYKRTVLNLGVEYRLRPGLAFSCDINNLENEPTIAYRGIRGRLQAYNVNGTTVTFGVNGRF